MTRLFDDPVANAIEATDGFARAVGAGVQTVQGGVIRRARNAEPTVSVVIDGGSGHDRMLGGSNVGKVT